MPTLFDVLYREFCRARLVEMRKQLSLWPGAGVVSEELCEAVESDEAAGCPRQEQDAYANTNYS
jgi:hypothetical protein